MTPKEQRAKLLTEIMEADQKDGLYDTPPSVEKKVTALDWYYDQTVIEGKTNYWELFEQAKQMEKEQISEAWNDGNLLGRNGHVVLDYSTGKEYYNETYNK